MAEVTDESIKEFFQSENGQALLSQPSGSTILADALQETDSANDVSIKAATVSIAAVNVSIAGNNTSVSLWDLILNGFSTGLYGIRLEAVLGQGFAYIQNASIGLCDASKAGFAFETNILKSKL